MTLQYSLVMLESKVGFGISQSFHDEVKRIWFFLNLIDDFLK